MPSKVFISWSGDLSKSLAEEIRSWLPCVLQSIEPYFTKEDTEKGTYWFGDIANELEASNTGVICLTKDNVNAPWILFEAGALLKNLGKAKVCPILFDIDLADLTGPLANIQSISFKKEDFKKLVKQINVNQENKLELEVLDSVFEKWWPDLEEKIKRILNSQPKKEERDTENIRTEKDILEEILLLARKDKIYNKKQRNVSRHALRHLLESLHELMYIGQKKEDIYISMFFEKLRMPIKEICYEIDEPELYERFLRDFKRFRYGKHRREIEDED